MSAYRTTITLISVAALAACSDNTSTGITSPSAAPSLAAGGNKGPSCAPNCATVERIVFQSGANGPGDLFIVKPDGTGLFQLTSGPDDDRNPAWSPDYSKVVFGRRTGFGPVSLWVVNADGSNLHQLFSDPSATGDDEPTWSPDGSRILFARGWFDAGNTWHRELFTVNANGGGMKQVTTTPVGLISSWAEEPDFSPDGARIAFVRYGNGVWEDVWTVNADGSNQTRLTTDPGTDADPVWSPDGTKIAFEHADQNTRYASRIGVMNANGSGQTFITSNTFDTEDPSWSRDGTRLVITSTQPIDPTHDAYRLWVINASGLGGLTALVASPTQQYGAAWSR